MWAAALASWQDYVPISRYNIALAILELLVEPSKSISRPSTPHHEQSRDDEQSWYWRWTCAEGNHRSNTDFSTMSVDMDLQALVMGSESLLSHIARPDGIPRLTKSLAEIVSYLLLARVASLGDVGT